MFYDAIANTHGLPRDPFKAIVAPRPIGWISSISADGVVNLAPYSFFNAMGDRPHYVVFGSGGPKDSLTNIEATGEFVCSLATYALKDAMNMSSAAVGPDVDEFALAGLTPVASEMVRPPRVGESPIALECKRVQTVNLPNFDGEAGPYTMVIGQVVGVHIADDLIVDGMVEITRARPIARLGYMDYAVVDEVFQLARPSV